MLQRFEYYLRGRSFDIWSDHMALVLALSGESPSRFVRAWWEYVGSFSFRAIHVPGSTNVLPDALSRLYTATDEASEAEFRGRLGQAQRAAVPIPASVIAAGLPDLDLMRRHEITISAAEDGYAPPTVEVAAVQRRGGDQWTYRDGVLDLLPSGEPTELPTADPSFPPGTLLSPQEEARQRLLDFYHTADDGHDGADVMVILTEWDRFRALDLERVKSLLKSPTIVDLRNVYRPDEMQALGFAYSSIGRP
jgi:hypothetical protein